MTSWELRCANKAAVAAGAIARPRGQAPREFPFWDSRHGVWTREEGGLSNGLEDDVEWRAPNEKPPKPAGHAQRKRGRPITPGSRHQHRRCSSRPRCSAESLSSELRSWSSRMSSLLSSTSS